MSADTIPYFDYMMFGREASTPAERVASEIAEDLFGRRGFDGLAHLAEEELQEIGKAWASIVAAEWRKGS